jgi:hypothetical protein
MGFLKKIKDIFVPNIGQSVETLVELTSTVEPALEPFPYEKLNMKEKTLVSALQRLQGPATISEITEMCKFEMQGAEDQKMCNSWTRNSLRRLLREGFIEKVNRGTYKLKKY